MGPTDPSVSVLGSSQAGWRTLSVVFGYACHATVLSSNEWSGDYPGYAQSELESLHPGCIAMFWAGCGADQNPLPRRTPQLAAHYGRRLADSVESVLLTTEMSSIEPELKVEYAEVPLRFSEIPSRERRSSKIYNLPIPTRCRGPSFSCKNLKHTVHRRNLSLSDPDMDTWQSWKRIRAMGCPRG